MILRCITSRNGLLRAVCGIPFFAPGRQLHLLVGEKKITFKKDSTDGCDPITLTTVDHYKVLYVQNLIKCDINVTLVTQARSCRARSLLKTRWTAAGTFTLGPVSHLVLAIHRRRSTLLIASSPSVREW